MQNIDKGDVLTLRSLFYLAYDLGGENLDTESRSISAEILNVEKGKNPRTVKSAEYLLAVHVAYNFPQLLIKALGQELRENSHAHQYAIRLAEFGLDDEQFKPLCPHCPNQPVTFAEQKYRRLVSPLATIPEEIKIQTDIRQSRLAKANEPVVLQIRRLIFEPQDQRIQELRDACYAKSGPDAKKPSIKDLGDMVNQKIIDLVNQGDLKLTQALILVSNERCWNEVDSIDGPRPWLATTIICRHPQIFVQASAVENPGGLFFEDIMKFDSPQALLNCTGQAVGEGDLQQIRVDKIKTAEAITAAEKNVVNYLIAQFDSSAKKSPSTESDNPNEPAIRALSSQETPSSDLAKSPKEKSIPTPSRHTDIITPQTEPEALEKTSSNPYPEPQSTSPNP